MVTRDTLRERIKELESALDQVLFGYGLWLDGEYRKSEIWLEGERILRKGNGCSRYVDSLRKETGA